MATTQKAAADTVAPSPAQWQELQTLHPEHGLLLQHHVVWKPGADRDRNREALVACTGVAGGQVISIATVDMLAIGSSDAARDDIWLIELPGPLAVSAYVASEAFLALQAEMASIEILVASVPHPKMRRMMKWMNRILPLMPAPRAGDDMPEEELRGGINPTPGQFEAFRKANQIVPVHMFNLLRFHDRAQYADGDRGRSGRRAYEDGYGRVAMECVLRLGGRLLMLGRYRLTLIGAGGDPATDAWDEIAVLQYPNRPAFIRMVGTPRYVRSLEHRHAGLAETEVWSAAPLPAYR